MVKKIKFNLLVDGKSIGDFDQLQDNFSADLLDFIENQKLAKWFSVRDMDDKAQQVSAIDLNAGPMVQMKALCQILELEEDEDVITYLLEEKEKRQKEQTIRQELTESSKTSVEESNELDDTDGSENNPRGEDWSGRDLSGRDFTGADLRGYNLTEVNFTNANLMDANLSGCDLSKANLDGAILNHADFTFCNLSEARITNIGTGFGKTLSQLWVEAWDENRRNRRGPNFSSANLDKSILSGDLSNANFTNAHAHDVNASDAVFTDSSGRIGRNFEAIMQNADFSFSILPKKHISEDQKKEAKMFGVKFV